MGIEVNDPLGCPELLLKRGPDYFSRNRRPDIIDRIPKYFSKIKFLPRWHTQLANALTYVLIARDSTDATELNLRLGLHVQ